MIDVQFVNQEEFQLNHLNEWLTKVCETENKQLGALAVVIGTDEWLLEINQTYLKHDFYTDIITFDYCEGTLISGDLLISLDRVEENAQTFGVSRETELNRVVVHGLLHLLGYSDSTEEEKKIMQQKEDFYLSLLF